MSRDYKHRINSQRERKKADVSKARLILAGLLIGLFIMFLLYLRQSAETDLSKDEKNSGFVVQPSPEKQLVNKKPADADKQGAPEFQFYTILPEKEVSTPVPIAEPDISLPQIESDNETQINQPNLPNTGKTGQYFLQAGSFRNGQDAKVLQGRIALMGLDVKLEEAVINGVTWKRVKVGPLNTMTEVQEVLARLRNNNINAMGPKSAQ